MIKHSFHFNAQSLQKISAFTDGNLLENLDVRRMDWEHFHKIIQPFRHIAVQGSELFQVFADPIHLVVCFSQQAMRDHVRDILFDDL